MPRAPFPNDLESQNVALFLVFPFLLFEKIVKETEAVAKGIWAVRHMTNSARFRLRDSARLRLTMGPRCVGACATVLTGRPGKDWPSLETLVHGTGGALQQGKGWGLGSLRHRAGGRMGGGGGHDCIWFGWVGLTDLFSHKEQSLICPAPLLLSSLFHVLVFKSSTIPLAARWAVCNSRYGQFPQQGGIYDETLADFTNYQL